MSTEGPPHRWWWLPALLTLLAVTAGGFALAHGSPPALDTSLLMWFRIHDDAGQLAGPGWATAIWLGVSWLGDSFARIGVAVAAIVALALRRHWPSAALLAGLLLSGSALTVALKHWVARPRPDLVVHLAEVSSSSFPSGHALNSTLFYVGAALLLARFLPRRRQRWTLHAAAASLTLATGISRVALGVHYPSDVVAGWILGGAWLWLWFAAAERCWPQAFPRQPASSRSTRECKVTR